MNGITTIEGLAFLATAAALAILIAGWKRALPFDTKFILAAILGLHLFNSFSNILEWSGLYPGLDYFEDFTQLLEPLFWGIFFYTFLQMTARQDIKENEERFRLLSEASFEGILIHDKERVIDTNSAFARMFGYPKEAVLGKSIYDFVAPEWRETVRKSVASGAQQAYEAQGIRRDGSVFPGTLRGNQMVYKGRPVRITAVRDLSERKKAEKALRDSEEKYRAVIENARDAIHIAQDGLIKFPNPRMSELTAYAGEELENAPFARLIHSEDRDMVVDRYRRRLAGEELSAPYAFRIINKSGEEIWVQLNTVRVTWEGRPATLNFLRDITEQRELEARFQQIQKMESVGRLAGGIAHDFNNMLGVIQGHTDLLMEQTDPAHAHYRELEEIRKAARRSTELTQRLLAFARKQTVAPRVLDLNATLSGMLNMFSRLVGDAIELIWKPDADLWPVRMDTAQLDQILANLCTNARDAMGGVGRITIETQNQLLETGDSAEAPEAGAAPGEYVMISVRDNGPGMNRETLEHLFEPFYTTKHASESRGLGLSMVYGIVKQNQGRIEVDSAPGQGAAFTIYLPRSQELPAAPEPAREKAISGGGETVLVVEDEEMVLELTRTMLERHGYTVLTASSPSRALATAEENRQKIALLLTDVVMPEMDGKKLRQETEKIIPGIKVLYMSGYTANVIVHAGDIEPDVAFLQKPFSTNELTEKVRAVLDRPAN